MAEPTSVASFSLQLQLCLRAPAARSVPEYWTIYWLFPNRHMDNAARSTDMRINTIKADNCDLF